MSAPAVLIVLELEAAPRVVVDALDEGDELRLAAWLEACPDYSELVARALELEHERRAA